MLNNVQALRALAALAVALSHLTKFSPAVGFLGIGTIGVELFFVISGFIMVYITNDHAQRPLDFFARRVVRVSRPWRYKPRIIMIREVAPASFLLIKTVPVPE